MRDGPICRQLLELWRQSDANRLLRNGCDRHSSHGAVGGLGLRRPNPAGTRSAGHTFLHQDFVKPRPHTKRH